MSFLKDKFFRGTANELEMKLSKKDFTSAEGASQHGNKIGSP